MDTQKNKPAIPRYQQIAVDVASRIATEEYKEGDKIYVRSSLASRYRVSPETARRAICVLCDLEIVTSEKGSGVTINSQKKAAEFIRQYNGRKTIDTIKENLLASVSRQKEEMDYFNKCLQQLIESSEHFRSMNPFMPFQVNITKECKYLNKTVSDIRLWQHTGATLLAVQRGEELLKSPGPYVALTENDILYFMTQDDSAERVKNFLYSET